MNEKTIVSAKTNNVLAGVLTLLVGGFIMATCLVWEGPLGDWPIFVALAVGAVVALCGLVFMFSGAECGLFVTDKRVYGKTLLGKRVDIPLDSISAVSLTLFLFWGVSVSSSSGRISFFFLENRDAIYNALSKLLIERQQTKKGQFAKSVTDEIKQYKELLDMGAISQNEFDKKKKELLG